MPRRTVARRSILQMLGVGAVLSPFVPLLEPEVSAATGTSKRLVLVHFPNGTAITKWRPSGTENDWALSEILEPLADFKEQMIVLDGVDNLPSAYARARVNDIPKFGMGHHGSGSFWTQHAAYDGNEAGCDGSNVEGNNCTWPNGPSLDQYIANRLADQTVHRSITAGIKCSSAAERHKRYFYDLNGLPVSPERDPSVLYDKLFADLALDPEAKERLRREGRSVVDAVLSDVKSLRPKLSGSDRQRLEEHLDHLHSLHGRITTLGAGQCDELPTAPPSGINLDDNDTLPQLSALHFELIANAFACDLTRVAAVQWGREGSWGRASWLGHTKGIHSISHWLNMTPEEGRQGMAEFHRFLAEQVATFVRTLQQKQLLDDTIIAFTSTMGRSDKHSERNVPVVLLQGANGKFKTNRYLRYGNYDPNVDPFGDHGGESMNRVCTSLCHAMGFDEVDSYGDEQFGAGPLPGL